MSMNNWTISGNLGRDAEVRNAGGTSVCSFSVAAKSGYGDKAQTIWVDCSLWGKQAEGSLPSYLKKGSKVVVSGEVGTREHNGKTYITLRVTSIDPFCNGRDTGAPAQPAPAQAAAPQPSQSDIDDDDIPF